MTDNFCFVERTLRRSLRARLSTGRYIIVIQHGLVHIQCNVIIVLQEKKTSLILMILLSGVTLILKVQYSMYNTKNKCILLTLFDSNVIVFNRVAVFACTIDSNLLVGCVVAVTGASSAECDIIKQICESRGGKFSEQLIEGICTHLLVQDSSSE